MLEKVEKNAEHWRSLAERQQALLESNSKHSTKTFLKRLLRI